MSTPPVLDRRVTVEGSSYVTTPRVRTTARRLAFWAGVLVFIAVITVIVLLIRGAGVGGDPLSASNSAGAGAKALIEVLRQDGVTVKTPRTLTAAESAISSPATTTLAVYDPNDYLTRDQLQQLAPLAQNIVLIDPSFHALQSVAPSVAAAGVGTTTLSAGCDFGPAAKAGTVAYDDVETPNFYRVVDKTVDATTCFGDKGAYALVRVTDGDSAVTVFGLPDALNNTTIVKKGNAALALGVFGSTDTLVWYLPSAADLTVDPASVPPRFPDWLNPAIALLALVAVAAAFWRGRRFGPLVVERMPVVVRSSETMEGRARLYQKASAREHALDALRIGTLTRIAGLLGLSRLATTDEIVDAATELTGRSRSDLRGILIDQRPATDAQLLRLSDALLKLERDVATATRPG